MKHYQLSLLIFAFLGNFAKAQNTDNFGKLKINSIPFQASEQSVLKALGRPVKKFKPNYECGFLSEHEQSKPFYTLKYNLLTFTGNTKDGYTVDNLMIVPNSKYHITYKGKVLSSSTTQKEFIILSGVKLVNKCTTLNIPKDLLKQVRKKNPVFTTTYLSNGNSEDKYICYFCEGKLCNIEYWSPC
jgi:hypothetical protein